MSPLFRATAVTVATLALVSSFDGSSNNNNNSNSVVAATADIHRSTQQQLDESYFGEDWIPPWRDTEPYVAVISITDPTAGPTNTPPTEPPTKAPTGPPTAPPQAAATASPTIAPTASTISDVEPEDVVNDVDPDAVLTTTFDEETGVNETSCALLPTIGNLVTEVLDIEYLLYLNEGEAIVDENTIQGIVDAFVEPRLHEALVTIGIGCDGANFVTGNHVMVGLSSSGQDLVGAACPIDTLDDATDMVLDSNITATAKATACYQVWGQIEATMWFAPRRQRRRLQGSTTTPFGDREAYNVFTEWMEEAVDSLAGSPTTDSDGATGVQVVKASFQGFGNVNGFDGTNLDLTTQDTNIDRTAAFMGTAWTTEDGRINDAVGLVAIVAGAMVLCLVVLVVVVRRKKSRQAFLEHAQIVEDMALDSNDDLTDGADLVDDESLFRGDRPLPDNFKLKLESDSHDYRWIGEERKNPIFVATERNKEFRDHLDVLKRKKEQEVRAKQYKSIML